MTILAFAASMRQLPMSPASWTAASRSDPAGPPSWSVVLKACRHRRPDLINSALAGVSYDRFQCNQDANPPDRFLVGSLAFCHRPRSCVTPMPTPLPPEDVGPE